MRELLAVIAGGVIGTGLRLGLDTALPHSPDGFPISTLVINVLGSFTLGFFVARLWPVVPDWLRAGFGPGLLGSFTTFSALTLGVIALADSGHLLVAVVYLAVTVIAGLAAAFAGITFGRPATREVPGAKK